MYYTVRIETEPVPEASWLDAIEGMLEGLSELAHIEGLVGWGGAPHTVGVVFDIDQTSAWDALEQGVVAFRSVAQTLSFVDLSTFRTLEAAPADEADEPSLLGATDVARVLGVSRQRVYQLLEAATSGVGRFPKPVAEAARGQLWNRNDVLAYRSLRESEEIVAERA
jgi:predicted DNA-binding transcriptional regulator AlpA